MEGYYVGCDVDVERIYREVANRMDVNVENIREEMPPEYLEKIVEFLSDGKVCKNNTLVDEIIELYDLLISATQRDGWNGGSLISRIWTDGNKLLVHAEPYGKLVKSYEKKNGLNVARGI